MESADWFSFAALAVTVLCGVWHLAQKVTKAEMRLNHYASRVDNHGRRLKELEQRAGIKTEHSSDTLPFKTGTDR